MEPGTTGHCRPVKVPRHDLSTPLRIELGGSRVEDEIVSQGEGLASRGERWDATVYFAQPSEYPSALRSASRLRYSSPRVAIKLAPLRRSHEHPRPRWILRCPLAWLSCRPPRPTWPRRPRAITLFLDLFRSVRTKNENLVCSPYSASLALTMTMAGAKGETQQEMKQVLHISLPDQRLHQAVNDLDKTLAVGGSFKCANFIWGQTGRSFKQPFVVLWATTTGLRSGCSTWTPTTPEPARPSTTG